MDDRGPILRLASLLPTGSLDRRTLLEGLRRAARTLELLEHLDAPKALERAWPNVTYKGEPLLVPSKIYPFYDKAADQVTEQDYQETFMGYVPDRDIFVVGFDVWPDEEEEEWDGDDWGDRWAARRKTAMASSQWVAVTFDGRVVDQGFAPGIFYPEGLKAVKRKFPKLIGLRYD